MKTAKYHSESGVIKVRIMETVDMDLVGKMVRVVSVDNKSKIYPRGHEWFIPERVAGLCLSN